MRWNGLFDPENSFWTFMNKVTDVCFLSLFWLLFSLPVVTIGASTVALFRFTLKQVDDSEGYAFRSFLKAFRENFARSTALWLLVLAGIVFFVLDFHALMALPLPSVVRVPILAILLSLSLLFLMMAVYSFPLLARYGMPLGKVLHDGLVMAFQHPLMTALVFLVHGFFIWVTYELPFLFWLFVSLSLFTSSYLFRRVLDSYET